jgi:predicted small lipoprotein YifL
MKKLIKVLAVGMLLATTLIGCEKQESEAEILGL